MSLGKTPQKRYNYLYAPNWWFRVALRMFCIVMIIPGSLALVMEGCATKTIPPNAFVVSGRMNPVSGSKALKTDKCWVLESGNDLRSLKYYRIMGSSELLEQLYEEDMIVTIRVVPKVDADNVCNVGTPVEVVEVVEARSKKN